MARLEDLKSEALLFGYEELASACDAARKDIQDAVEEALKPEPEPSASCHGVVVDAGRMIRPSPRTRRQDSLHCIRNTCRKSTCKKIQT